MIKRLKYIYMIFVTHCWARELDPNNYSKHMRDLKEKWYPEEYCQHIWGTCILASKGKKFRQCRKCGLKEYKDL